MCIITPVTTSLGRIYEDKRRKNENGLGYKDDGFSKMFNKKWGLENPSSDRKGDRFCAPLLECWSKDIRSSTQGG